MPADTTSVSPIPSGWRDFLVGALCLGAVLAVCFHKSFEPDQILFSNDGPLGANRAQAEYALGNFLGFWQNLNWIGMEYPGMFLTVSGFLIAACCTVSPDFGPVLFAKIYAPVGLFLLGLSTWFLCRQLRFRPWVSLLAGLAASLNTTAFSVACWGLATWPLAWSMNVFAIAALAAPSIRNWAVKSALAGLAVGLGVMEGFDLGAIFSIFAAAFAFLRGITTQETPAKTLTRSFASVGIMVVCAGLIAAQAVSTLIGTQVKGVAGMAQDAASKQKRWDEATTWSLPKAETLRFIIPGLFGYRMPELYGEQPQLANGSNYWGAVGQTPGVIQSRHSGMGVSAGVLVALIAGWGVAQSFRQKNPAFLPQERRLIWCWLTLLVIALGLAWGRHAPFYRIAYAIPYFSTMRNPIKYVFPFSLALLILFGYGLEGLCRLYLNKAPVKTKAWLDQFKSWWKNAPAFDKKWTLGSIIAVAGSLLGRLIYASSKRDLVRYLRQAGFPDERLAESIAQFSLNEVGWFILFLILSAGLLTLMMSGVFAGPRVKWAWVALGLVLVLDLGRADAPWIVYWNYKEKYASNPVIDLLREKPYQHRVTAELVPLTRSYLVSQEGQNFAALYGYEWLQHLFQYYRIQSLDVIQMPREPEFDKAYMTTFRPTTNDNTLSLCGRLWQLTNTRYVLGMTSSLEFLNTRVDPIQRRFRVETTFEVVPKPGITLASKPEHLTAVPATNGQFALFEFSGALPRATLFSRWRVNTNDAATLEELRNSNFDPTQSVFVANELPPASHSTNSPTTGTVEFSRYEPKFIQLRADGAAPAVLLLNDRFHPDWKAWVDGKPATVLRCNYIMRGVYLTPGDHVIEFRFQPPATAFYVSLGAFILGLGLCGFLLISERRSKISMD